MGVRIPPGLPTNEIVLGSGKSRNEDGKDQGILADHKTVLPGSARGIEESYLAFKKGDDCLHFRGLDHGGDGCLFFGDRGLGPLPLGQDIPGLIRG